MSERTRDPDLAFFGTFVASMSHELKNVLATVNEFSGLLDDLVAASERGRPLKPERLRHIAGKITAQMERGEELISRLNRFSHSVDAPGRKVEVGALLADCVAFGERFAMLERVALELELPDPQITLSLDPFAFHRAVFFAVRLALAAAGEERRIAVTLVTASTPRRIVLQSGDPLAPARAPAGVLDALEVSVGRLGGRLRLEGDPPRRIVIVLPDQPGVGGEDK